MKKILILLTILLTFSILIGCGEDDEGEKIRCGDGVCSESSEDIDSCPQDCAICGDQVCTESVENLSNCAQDCVECGDQTCTEEFENLDNCAQDCAECGDQICTEGVENLDNCLEDCIECGDGVCSTGEDQTCPDDCVERFSHEMSVNLHSADVHYISAIDYEVTNADNFHFAISKSASGPIVILSDDVSAVNLGDSETFFDITEADPNLNYQNDDGDNYVIGASWISGGDGETGFTMSGDIYILKLSDNSYVKLEMLSAVSGAIIFRLFRDPLGGTNLTCTEN